MAKNVLVVIADGSEEIEAVCIIDVLRRAEASVTVASVGDIQVTASRGVRLVGDCLISECLDTTFDLIALPGGMPGAENLRDSKELTQMLKKQHDEGRLYAAICASPAVILKHHDLIGSRRATCYPSFTDSLDNKESINSRVVVDGQCITSKGPGTAIEFSLKLVEQLFGKDKAAEIANDMVVS